MCVVCLSSRRSTFTLALCACVGQEEPQSTALVRALRHLQADVMAAQSKAAVAMSERLQFQLKAMDATAYSDEVAMHATCCGQPNR